VFDARVVVRRAHTLLCTIRGCDVSPPRWVGLSDDARCRSRRHAVGMSGRNDTKPRTQPCLGTAHGMRPASVPVRARHAGSVPLTHINHRNLSHHIPYAPRHAL